MTLEEKGIPYDIKYIDLADKPDWFLAISPLGKVPVLLVDDTAIFESAVINEFIEETTAGRMHPEDAVERAHHRAWIEFVSTLLVDSFGMAIAPDEALARKKAATVKAKLARLEEQVSGPLFGGEALSLVDAATAPLLQRLTWYQEFVPSLAFFEGLPKIAAWRDALFSRASFQRSAIPHLREEFVRYTRETVQRAPSADKPPWFARQLVDAS